MSHGLKMTEAQLAEHIARNKAFRQARAHPEASQPKPVPALLQPPATFGQGMIEFTVPGNPVPKGRPRLGRGHTYTPKRTVEAENVIQSVAQLAGIIPLVGSIMLTLDFFLPIPKQWSKAKTQSAMLGTIRPGRPDLDNLAKTVMDALNTIAFTDDSQIVELICRKWFSCSPRTVVKIVPIPA